MFQEGGRSISIGLQGSSYLIEPSSTEISEILRPNSTL